MLQDIDSLYIQLQVFLITSGTRRILAVYAPALTRTFNIVLQEQTMHEMSESERRMKREKEEEKKIKTTALQTQYLFSQQEFLQVHPFLCSSPMI